MTINSPLSSNSGTQTPSNFWLYHLQYVAFKGCNASLHQVGERWKSQVKKALWIFQNSDLKMNHRIVEAIASPVTTFQQPHIMERGTQFLGRLLCFFEIVYPSGHLFLHVKLSPREPIQSPSRNHLKVQNILENATFFTSSKCGASWAYNS